MNSSSYRKILLAAPLLTLAAGASACSGTGSATATPRPTAVATSRAQADETFAGLERRFHARLGVYALEVGTGDAVAYNADERFAYCSTYKALATGMLLQRDTGAQLGEVVHYTAGDLVEWSPVTSRHVHTGMALRAVMAAALDYSDNTAANLLLNQLGGPRGLGEALRRFGDDTTDTDRTEPTLNDVPPGDTQDTTTPRAIGTDLRRLVLGNVLPAGRRQLLTGWMLSNTTGGPYIRAGVPRGWRVADKTGNGEWGARNDIAVAWPPGGGAPIVIAILSHRESINATSDDALLSDATTAALSELRR
jgi:beta-lactamase class A